MIFWKTSAVPAIRGLLGCMLLFSVATVAEAEGTYQRTKDGKTIIWNQDPKPGDTASWSGDRDRDGYATGFGTLTWSKTRKPAGGESKETVYASFFGNMIRGKLDGPVNGHSKGMTGHAVFEEGKRASRWAAGAAPSWKVPRSNRNPAVVDLVVAKAESTSRSEFNPAPPSSAANSHERPAPDYNSLPKQPNHPVEEAPAEGPVQNEKPAATPQAATPPAPAGPKLEIDDSLRSLTGPPPSLGLGSPAGDNSGKQQPDAEKSSPTNGNLTKEEVADLADGAARNKGYDLNGYQHAEPQFDSIDGTWSVFYERKPDSRGTEGGKHLTVAVDDKSKRTAIVPAR